MLESHVPIRHAATRPPQGYAGDVPPEKAWRLLKEDGRAQLIDVRTMAEWSYVGLPDLTELGRRPLLIEWQTFPDSAVNPGFADQIAKAVPEKDTPLLFLCRSGARSASAALTMTSRGYTQCYNIAQGFEGEPDSQNHRGRISGWKVLGLPWVQS